VLKGKRAWAEIQDVQARGDICLISSRNDATSLSALEPLSRGVPVVGTDVGDIRQHLGPALARFATPPDDPGALADAIVELCENYSHYARLFLKNAERLRYHHGDGPDALTALAEELVPRRDPVSAPEIRNGGIDDIGAGEARSRLRDSAF
jgi:glycosyltransferase involved in cell wall biosynthesis